MNNFGKFLTPEQAYQLDKERGRWATLAHYQRLAKTEGICAACDTEEIWKYGDTGLCFSCTTGEADANDDYELKL